MLQSPPPNRGILPLQRDLNPKTATIFRTKKKKPKMRRSLAATGQYPSGQPKILKRNPNKASSNQQQGGSGLYPPGPAPNLNEANPANIWRRCGTNNAPKFSWAKSSTMHSAETTTITTFLLPNSPLQPPSSSSITTTLARSYSNKDKQKKNLKNHPIKTEGSFNL